MMWRDALTAMGLALVIEGVLYAAFPHAIRRMTLQITAVEPGKLRAPALIVAVLGLIIVWFVRG